MRIPCGLIFRASFHEAINAQIPQRFITYALDGMKGRRRDPYDVVGVYFELFLPFADREEAIALHHVEDLFGVVVLVRRRRLSLFENNYENFGR